MKQALNETKDETLLRRAYWILEADLDAESFPDPIGPAAQASALAWAETKGKFEDFQAAAKIIVNSANEPSSGLSKDDFPF